MKVLIDTNILSEARRTGGHPAIKQFLMDADDSDLHMSVITIGEIARGIAKLEPGARQVELEAWLAATERLFAKRVLPIDRDVAIRWGKITDQCARSGHVLGQADGLIAATALENGMAVVTRNSRDFDPTGVRVIDPCDTGAS